MKEKRNISHAELKEIFSYDEQTGLLSWKKTGMGRNNSRVAGSIRPDGYRIVHFAGGYHYIHRVAWFYVHGTWPSGVVDHIDGNPSNNAIGNLRVVSKRTNAENVRGPTSASKTGYLGVYQSRGVGSFIAQIRVNGKRLHIGSFKTALEAYDAYLSAKRKLHLGFML